MTSLVYSTGTVAVSAGNAVVTGTGTAWDTALVKGGMFSFAGMSVPISSVESDTSLTLAYAWPGTTASGAYAIARETSEAVRAAWINDRMAQILTKPWGTGVVPDGRGTLAERDALSPMPTDKFCWLREEAGFDPSLYFKTLLGWIGPYPLVGEPGVGEGGYGLPTGGTTGQVPTKSSGTDGDVAWADPAGAVASVNGQTDVVVLDAGDIGFTAGGGISATNVQAAIVELDSEKVAVSSVREKLTANRTYYVRTNGSDANSGLTNTSGGAFLTIQRAYDVIVSTLDLAGFTVTIQVGAGTYTGGLTISKGWTGAGEIILLGDETTPANVEVTTAILVRVDVVLPAALRVRGFKHSAAIQSIVHNGVGPLFFRNLIFNSTGFAHIQGANNGAKIWIEGSYSVTAGASFHYYIAQQSGLQRVSGATVNITVVGTLAFTVFAGASDASALIISGVTFDTTAATVTGVRYQATTLGLISTNGGGASFFPGSSAGSTAAGGQYA